MRLPSAGLLGIWRAAFPSRVGPAAKCSCRSMPCLPWPWRASASASKGGRAMSRSFRRYEILLPRQFNDGQTVPDDLFAETLLELEQHFGAVSSETQIIRGVWQHEGQSFRDDLVRRFVDV